MEYSYKTKGTCSREIHFEVEDGILKNVEFIGGCNGNLKGIGSLVEGMEVEDVIERLEGITCGFKPTSCPDHLAKSLK
ncbi:MAG: TIGR03905 family TSCPD domain-containing protein [Oscillospiraceae bacterium]|nr:TIGR03905 family TSCPD domain-containing protein [Oscillospiraceae bacterium]